MLTTRELLDKIGVTEDRLRHAIRNGRLRPRRVSHVFLWPPQEVDKAKRLLQVGQTDYGTKEEVECPEYAQSNRNSGLTRRSVP